MKKKISLLYPFLIAVLMVLIFILSGQVADDSSLTSGRVCRFLAKHLFTNFKSMSAETQGQIVAGMTHIVRKGAHFSEYALMGFLWYLWLYRIRLAPLLSVFATTLYAATDEFHQTFVQGRSGEVHDVLIDSAGGVFGVLIAFILLCIFYCIRRRKVVSWGTWGEEV